MGDNTATSLAETDFLGRPRILNGGKSLTVDKGAIEFYRTTCAPGPGPNQVTIAWDSLAGRTYAIYCSEDLVTWRLAERRAPSAGNVATSWTDDGSKTGALPGAVPWRFYRCVENP
jgi:hypothetical protein